MAIASQRGKNEGAVLCVPRMSNARDKAGSFRGQSRL